MRFGKREAQLTFSSQLSKIISIKSHQRQTLHGLQCKQIQQYFQKNMFRRHQLTSRESSGYRLAAQPIHLLEHLMVKAIQFQIWLFMVMVNIKGFLDIHQMQY